MNRVEIKIMEVHVEEVSLCRDLCLDRRRYISSLMEKELEPLHFLLFVHSS